MDYGQDNLIKRQEKVINEQKEKLYLEETKLNKIKKLLSEIKHDKLEEAFKTIGLIPLPNCFLNYRSADTLEEVLNSTLTLEGRFTSKKIKKIKFNGFDSEGRGKNHKRLEEKAKGIEDKIFEITGYKSNVNHYSLEYENEKDKESSILITIFL